MGVAIELMDAVTAKLNETTFGTATVSRQIIPDFVKKDGTPTIIVSISSKESFEVDRTKEHVVYGVVVALHYPSPNGNADYEVALDMTEDIQDWLSDKDNRNLTLATEGEACLVLPFEMDGIVDGALVREAGLYFSLTTFKYIHYKDRA